MSSRAVIPKGGNLWKKTTDYENSKYEILEKYLISVLGQKDLIKIKLENPLSVADRITSDSLKKLENRKISLESDFCILEMIEENMKVFQGDIERDISNYRTLIKELLNKMKSRCNVFLDENLSIFKPTLLLNSTAFQHEFNQQVLMDLKRPIDDIILTMRCVVFVDIYT